MQWHTCADRERTAWGRTMGRQSMGRRETDGERMRARRTRREKK
jgi:hypothetical protein